MPRSRQRLFSLPSSSFAAYELSRALGKASVSRRQTLAGMSALGGMALLSSALRRPAAAQSETTHGNHSLQPQPSATPEWLIFSPGELVEPEVWHSIEGELRSDLRLAYAF